MVEADSSLVDFDEGRPSQNYVGLPNYDVVRTPEDPAFGRYALPGSASAQLQIPAAVYDPPIDQMVYGASSKFQPPTAYQTSGLAYSLDSHKDLEKISYDPQSGFDATTVYVYLTSSRDILHTSPKIASLMFADCQVPATIHGIEAHDGYYKYAIIGNAPSSSSTRSLSNPVALQLQLQEPSGLETEVLEVGNWLYENVKQHQLRPSPKLPRKRKLTMESSDEASNTKRISQPPYSRADSQELGSYTYAPETPPAYPHDLHTGDLNPMRRKLTSYSRSPSRQQLRHDSPQLSVPGDNAASLALMKPPTTQVPHYSPSYAMAAFHNQSNVSNLQTPNPSNPTLMRASTMQQQTGSTSTSAASSTDGNLNPFALYPNRAIISLRGDLDSMQRDWTAEERAAKRRLVRFRGEQVGSTVNTYFKAVKPDERASPSESRERRISCIYWEERGEYFVTSVDTILLLETLVGTKFMVDEKNRIRRNLETHHPETISKGKPEYEAFFKVIMGFQNPKPRNIEKDVKVFPWSILAQALKKVFSKYVSCFYKTPYPKAKRSQQASPAPVAGPSRKVSRSRYSVDQSVTRLDQRAPVLSRSNTATSTGSSPYARPLKSSTLSPPTNPQSLHPRYLPQAPLSASLPQAYSIPTLASQYSSPDPRSSFVTSYNPQTTVADLSQAYTAQSAGRRRSSDVTHPDTSFAHYSPRPRANTSFSALYQATQQDVDYAQPMEHIPGSEQPVRGSWDMGAYLQADPGYVGTSHTSYGVPGGQDPRASSYHQPTTTGEPR